MIRNKSGAVLGNTVRDPHQSLWYYWSCIPTEDHGMDTSTHDLTTLFQQLGLPADAPAIDAFIRRHRPLPEATKLPNARFWTPAQAEFLREAWQQDAEWSEAVDELDARLRH